MVEDAKKGRPFSNIVVEYTKDFDPEHPIKVIGGQHRFEAIKAALANNVNENHGLKVYIDMTPEQRLDAQLISNTNLAVSADLLDRMQETQRGPALRDWCQRVGLLPPGDDFTDKYERGGAISVQMARTFILSYYAGVTAAGNDFKKTETLPVVAHRGQEDENWGDIARDGKTWKDAGLQKAAEEFVALVAAQRAYFSKKKKVPRDRPEKALNTALMAAWAFVATSE